MSENVLSRDERIEQFRREKVEHTEWWSEQMSLVDEIADELLQAIADRDDARVTRRGKEVNKSGSHELRLSVEVAGEPWTGVDDDAEGER